MWISLRKNGSIEPERRRRQTRHTKNRKRQKTSNRNSEYLLLTWIKTHTKYENMKIPIFVSSGILYSHFLIYVIYDICCSVHVISYYSQKPFKHMYIYMPNFIFTIHSDFWFRAAYAFPFELPWIEEFTAIKWEVMMIMYFFSLSLSVCVLCRFLCASKRASERAIELNCDCSYSKPWFFANQNIEMSIANMQSHKIVDETHCFQTSKKTTTTYSLDSLLCRCCNEKQNPYHLE